MCNLEYGVVCCCFDNNDEQTNRAAAAGLFADVCKAAYFVYHIKLETKSFPTPYDAQTISKVNTE